MVQLHQLKQQTQRSNNLFELNKGVESQYLDDSGLIIERGSTGDNVVMMWDRSGDKFVVGTTTAAIR